jgi:hypothetical protein
LPPGRKKGKTKNVMHAVWSVAVIGKKKETQKMSCTLSGLAVVAIGPKK